LNTFSSVKKTRSVANWKNFPRSSLRAVQFASVSSSAPRLLKHFSCRSFRMVRTADDCPPGFSRTALVLLVLLTQNHIVHLVIVFIRAGTSRSVAALTSVHCARVSELPEQPMLILLVVHTLSENSILNCLALHCISTSRSAAAERPREP